MGLLTLLVHNDAVKSDPTEIYGWRVYALACAVSPKTGIGSGIDADVAQACFGAMLFGVETGIIGGVLTMEPFQKDYGLWEREDVAKANLEANIGTGHGQSFSAASLV